MDWILMEKYIFFGLHVAFTVINCYILLWHAWFVHCSDCLYNCMKLRKSRLKTGWFTVIAGEADRRAITKQSRNASGLVHFWCSILKKTMSCESSPLLHSFSSPAEKLGTRHVQIFLMFLGIAIAYAVRVCMSVTIVAMTDAKSANPNFPVRAMFYLFLF